MNNRIEELAKQAGFKHPDHVGLCEEYAYFDHKKFAELIVRQCARKCDTFSSFTKDKYPEAYETATNIRYNILDHFGIKE